MLIFCFHKIDCVFVDNVLCSRTRVQRYDLLSHIPRKKLHKNFQELLDLSNSRLRVSAGWRKNHVSSSLRGLFYSLSAGGIGLIATDDVEVLVVDDLACGGLRVCFCRIQVVRVV